MKRKRSEHSWHRSRDQDIQAREKDHFNQRKQQDGVHHYSARSCYACFENVCQLPSGELENKMIEHGNRYKCYIYYYNKAIA